MANVVPMGTTEYPMCSFQTSNVLISYTLSDLSRVASMGTPPIVQGYFNTSD